MFGALALSVPSGLSGCAEYLGAERPVDPLARLARGPSRPLVGATAEGLAISPDGRYLAFEGQVENGASPAEFFVYDRRTQECARYRLSDPDQPSDRSYMLQMASFAPQGDLIAVAAHRAIDPAELEFSDLAVFPVEGGRARRFGDRAYYHSYPTFSRDGRLLGCMRTVSPLRADGWHVDDPSPLYHRIHEFDMADGRAREFASVEFAIRDAFFYDEAAQSVWLTSHRPLKAGERTGALGDLDDDRRVQIWRVPRDAVPGQVTQPEVPYTFAGTLPDLMCGADRDGGFFVCTRLPPPELELSTDDLGLMAFYRLYAGESEQVLSFDDAGFSFPCVARDKPVFAWLTLIETTSGAFQSALQIVDEAETRTELITLNDVMPSLIERTVTS